VSKRLLTVCLIAITLTGCFTAALPGAYKPDVTQLEVQDPPAVAYRKVRGAFLSMSAVIQQGNQAEGMLQAEDQHGAVMTATITPSGGGSRLDIRRIIRSDGVIFGKPATAADVVQAYQHQP
jgi:hypothetical protein